MKLVTDPKEAGHPYSRDLFDWKGCEAVQFDLEKLGGRATVGATRMDADGVLLNYADGMTPEEISDHFGSDLQAIRTIIAFAEARNLKATA